MPTSFLEVEPRNFKPMPVPALSNEAREAVNAALKAMSTWRNEIAETSEKNGKQVIEKMAAAATALGWPAQIVDSNRTQMQSIAEMQIKAMDHMMDAWEEQLKLPNPRSASPSAMLQKLRPSSGSGSLGNWPGADAFGMGATNPVQFWIQVADQWQKSWTDLMTGWTKAGRSSDDASLRRH